MRAVSFVELYAITKSDFLDVLKHFPDEKQKIFQGAVEARKMHNESISHRTSLKEAKLNMDLNRPVRKTLDPESAAAATAAATASLKTADAAEPVAEEDQELEHSGRIREWIDTRVERLRVELAEDVHSTTARIDQVREGQRRIEAKLDALLSRLGDQLCAGVEAKRARARAREEPGSPCARAAKRARLSSKPAPHGERAPAQLLRALGVPGPLAALGEVLQGLAGVHVVPEHGEPHA